MSEVAFAVIEREMLMPLRVLSVAPAPPQTAPPLMMKGGETIRTFWRDIIGTGRAGVPDDIATSAETR